MMSFKMLVLTVSLMWLDSLNHGTLYSFTIESFIVHVYIKLSLDHCMHAITRCNISYRSQMQLGLTLHVIRFLIESGSGSQVARRLTNNKNAANLLEPSSHLKNQCALFAE